MTSIAEKIKQLSEDDEIEEKIEEKQIDLLRHVRDDHVLKRLSAHVAKRANLPPSTVFLLSIGVYGAMLSRKLTVSYPDGRSLPVGLYIVAEQDSGSAKSWCLNMLLEPFEEIYEEEYNDTVGKLAELEKEKYMNEAQEDQYKKLKSHINYFSSGLSVTNATSEGLESTLANTKGHFAAISSEQGLLNSLFGFSYGNENKVNNNDVALEGFSGGRVSSVRVSRKGYVGHVAGGIVCFSQDGSIKKVIDVSDRTGLSERFLMISEPSMFDSLDYVKQREVKSDELLLKKYQKSCEFFRATVQTPVKYKKMISMNIDEEGTRLIDEYRNKAKAELGRLGQLDNNFLISSFAKTDMQVMKIAATLHAAHGNGDFFDDVYISNEFVASAINIIDDLWHARIKICDSQGLTGSSAEFDSILSLFEINPAPRTEAIIIKRKLKTIPFKDMKKDKTKAIRSALEKMVKCGLLKVRPIEDVPHYFLNK